MEGRKGWRNHPKHGRMFLTIAQFNVLGAMNTLRLKGNYFVDLDDVHGQIITSLVGRGYITPRSAASGEHVYRMTGLGLDAYNLFKVPRLYRRDGLCPRCGKRPRQDYGHRLGNYCAECAAQVRHNHYRAKATLRDPNKPCARCGATPRHVTPSAVSSYCFECYREQARIERVRREQRIRDRAAAGKVTICSHPGCDKPVRISAHSISAYCAEHSNQKRMNSHYRRMARKYANLRVLPRLQQAGD